MKRLVVGSLYGLAILGGCSFDWDAYDPRLSEGAPAAGGAGGLGGTTADGGSTSTSGGAGGDGTCTVDADCARGSFCGCASIGVVGVTENSTPTGPLTIATPSEVEDGDVLIVGIAVRPDDAMAVTPAGWTSIRVTTSSASITENLHSYYRVVEAGEAASHTWTFSDAHTGAVGGIIALRGADPVAPIEADDGQSIDGATIFGGLPVDAPSLSTSGPQSMIVSLYGATSSSQWQPPPGMTEAVDLSTLGASTAGETLLMSYAPQGAAGDSGVKTATVERHDGPTAVSQIIAVRQLCVSDRCTPQQADGWTCTADTQCQSGMCVENHCCGGTCRGACEACDVAGSLGTCAPATAGRHGEPDCSPYACDGTLTSCSVSCSSHVDCKGGFFCNGSGSCVPIRSDGEPCSAEAQCSSGNCADGYCCDTDCGGACNACDRPGNEGTCGPVAAGGTGTPSCTPYLCDGSSSSCPATCTLAADCASGFTCTGGSCI